MASKFTLLLAAALAVVIGGMDLAGWALDIDVLKSILPDWVAMKPNTALAFILIGLALWLQPNPQPPTFNLQLFRLRFARLCALLAGLIGLLTLLEYAFGWNPGFDQWLFPEPAGAVGTSHPGRMAPETALCFALLAAALWITSGSRPTRRALLSAALSGLLVTTLAVAALLCYFTPALGAYGWWGLTIMAVPTSATFVALGLAVIAITWQPGVLAWSLDRKTTVAFVGGLALLVFIGLNTNRTLVRMGKIDDRITLTEQALHASSHILAELTKAQSSTRNYIITGDERFASFYLAAATRSRQELASLRRLTAADPHQQQRITRLETQITLALQWWQQAIDTRRTGSVAAGIQRTMAGDGLTLLDNLTANIEQMQNQDRQLFRDLHQESEGVARLSYLIISAGTLASLVIFLAVLLGLNRAVTKRQQAEATLRESEERYRLLVELSPDAIFICCGGKVAYINAAGLKLFGATQPDQILGRPVLELIHPDCREVVAARIATQGRAPLIEEQYLRLDGSSVDVEVTAMPFNLNGQPARMAIARDITERKQAASRIEHLNQLLLAIRETNMLIVRERDAQKLLAQACHNLARTRGYSLVWIGLAEPGSKRVVPAARVGAQTDYVDLFTVTWDESPSGLGPTGTAMRTGQPWVCHDTATDPRFAPWREAALARGYASLAATPMIHGTRVLGAVMVYSDQKDAFLDEEIGLLKELAGDLALALQSIEDEQERKKAEVELRRITRLHAMVLDSAGEGIIGLDTEGRHTFVNPVAAKMLGYTEAELIDRPSHPTWHHTKSDGSAYPQAECPITAAIRDGTVHLKSDELFWRKDGTSFPAEFVSTPIVDHGQVVGAVVAFKDITERQQTKARLYLQSAALESAANAIVITERDGTILWANPAFTRLTGYAVEEAVGQNPRLLKSGQQDQALYRELWETILAGNVWHGELRNKRKDGSVYQEEMTVAPVKDEQGQVTHFIAIKQDITEKRDLEKRMLRAQRMESIGQLAGGIAHDLNNVLSPILMATQLLREGRTDPESEKYRAIIEASAKRGADIVKQVLTFSRGVQGERVALQPRHLVKEVSKLIRDTFPKDIRVEANLPNDLWQVRGDATQIHQVLMNLCVNARDAMPRGGLLRLTAQNQVVDEALASMIPGAKPGQYVTLTVSDTGTGMTPAVMDRMFEPFFTTKAQGKGTGLGLATTFGIVKSHGGFLQVASEVGRGSQFLVFLPAVIETEIAADKSGSELPPRGQGEGILIVDDEQAIREVAARILTQHGYQVLAAADGEEGVVQFVQHRQKIALIISDLMMPGMDGLAMSRAILRLDPAAKIVISTGLMVGSDIAPKVAELKEMGITRFLTKPYPREVLLAEIHKALHNGADEQRQDG